MLASPLRNMWSSLLTFQIQTSPKPVTRGTIASIYPITLTYIYHVHIQIYSMHTHAIQRVARAAADNAIQMENRQGLRARGQYTLNQSPRLRLHTESVTQAVMHSIILLILPTKVSPIHRLTYSHMLSLTRFTYSSIHSPIHAITDSFSDPPTHILANTFACPHN